MGKQIKAEEKHSEVMSILKGEMGLDQPVIDAVNDNKLVVTLARHRADAFTLMVDDSAVDYRVVCEKKLPQQQRDMVSYSSVVVTPSE